MGGISAGEGGGGGGGRTSGQELMNGGGGGGGINGVGGKNMPFSTSK